jgi:hypothetical protein
MITFLTLATKIPGKIRNRIGPDSNQMAPWTGYVSQNYRSSDRDPKEIFADTWYVINLSTTLAESI